MLPQHIGPITLLGSSLINFVKKQLPNLYELFYLSFQTITLSNTKRFKAAFILDIDWLRLAKNNRPDLFYIIYRPVLRVLKDSPYISPKKRLYAIFNPSENLSLVHTKVERFIKIYISQVKEHPLSRVINWEIFLFGGISTSQRFDQFYCNFFIYKI